jgi:hypothetical protein
MIRQVAMSDRGLTHGNPPIPITDWITAIATASAVIVALVLAFLSDIRKWHKKPKFDMKIQNEEPFCRHTMLIIGKRPDGAQITVPAFWIRLRVTNTGHSVARQCEGKLTRIIEVSNDKERTDFDPTVLHWAGSTHNPIDINITEYEYLDVVYTRADYPNNIFIGAEEPTNPRGINLTPPRLDYRLHIELYGANVEPLHRTFHLKNGPQYDEIELEPV